MTGAAVQKPEPLSQKLGMHVHVKSSRERKLAGKYRAMPPDTLLRAEKAISDKLIAADTHNERLLLYEKLSAVEIVMEEKGIVGNGILENNVLVETIFTLVSAERDKWC